MLDGDVVNGVGFRTDGVGIARGSGCGRCCWDVDLERHFRRCSYYNEVFLVGVC